MFGGGDDRMMYQDSKLVYPESLSLGVEKFVASEFHIFFNLSVKSI